jgi:hypothetical protein
MRLWKDTDGIETLGEVREGHGRLCETVSSDRRQKLVALAKAINCMEN